MYVRHAIGGSGMDGVTESLVSLVPVKHYSSVVDDSSRGIFTEVREILASKLMGKHEHYEDKTVETRVAARLRQGRG